jgi:hypothetical protein
MSRSLFAVVVCASVLISASSRAEWDPVELSKEDTLDFLTVGPEEGEHWSKVWLVVLDGQMYIRLGSRAASRMEKNTTAPYVKVRIAGQEFDRVRAEPVPEMADRVADAIAEKYWSDFFIRLFPHPLTMRLSLAEQ